MRMRDCAAFMTLQRARSHEMQRSRYKFMLLFEAYRSKR